MQIKTTSRCCSHPSNLQKFKSFKVYSIEEAMEKQACLYIVVGIAKLSTTHGGKVGNI